MQKNSFFFPNLDGFRFIAFLIVFLTHGFSEVINRYETGGFLITTLKIGFFQSAQLGVSFFFVLSGFLITYLTMAEANKFGKVNVQAFYIRRALRIFPLYFLFLIVVFVFLPRFTPLNLPAPSYYFFFLSNFDLINNSGTDIHLTDVTWSISVEEQFYFAWAIVLFFIKPKYYLHIFLAIILGSAFFRWTNSDRLTLYFHTFSVMSELAVGGLTAYLAINSERFKSFFVDLSKWAIASTYILIIPFLLFSRFLFLYGTFGRIILGLIFAFIITEQNYSKNSFYKMSNFKTFSALGKYTYGLYLLHPLVIYFVLEFAKQYDCDVLSIGTGSVLGIISFIITLVICYLSFKYFESPFLSLKRRFAYIQTNQESNSLEIEKGSVEQAS